MTEVLDLPNQIIKQLYLDRDVTGDVTFIVETEQIHVHKCVLVALSSKYRAQFCGPNPDEGDVTVAHVSASSFKEFIKFFYVETVDLSVENIEEILDLSKQSLVDDFIETCESFLMKTVAELNNVCWCYRLAILYDNKQLRNHCEELISENTTNVLTSSDFIECDREVLLNILKMDTINCKETEIFNACIKWARAACKHKNLDDTDVKNLRTVLGDVVYQIRFASMSMEEFTTLHKSHEGFFSSDESIEIFYIIGKLQEFNSQKFNQNQRILFVTPQIPAVPYLNLNPVIFVVQREQVSPTSSPVHNDTKKLDAFWPDHSLRLHGFTLGVDLKDHFDRFAETFEIKVSNMFFFKKRDIILPKYSVEFQDDETTFMFEQPIEVIKSGAFDGLTRFHFKLPEMAKIHGKKLAKGKTEHGVEFRFMGDLLIQIFFTKL